MVTTMTASRQVLGMDVVLNNGLGDGMVVVDLSQMVCTMSVETWRLFGRASASSAAFRLLEEKMKFLLEEKMKFLHANGIEIGQVDVFAAVPPSVGTSVQAVVGPARRGPVPVSKRRRSVPTGRLESAQLAMTELVQAMAVARTTHTSPGAMAEFAASYGKLRAQITSAREALTELEGAWDTVQNQMVALMGE